MLQLKRYSGHENATNVRDHYGFSGDALRDSEIGAQVVVLRDSNRILPLHATTRLWFLQHRGNVVYAFPFIT